MTALILLDLTADRVMSPTLSMLRRAAPGLTRHLFPRSALCQRCQKSNLPQRNFPFQRRTARSSVYSLRDISTWTTSSKSGVLPTLEQSSGLPLTENGLRHSGIPIRSSFFPEETERPVGYWLLASAASVFGIVVFGGLTRLTESG